MNFFKRLLGGKKSGLETITTESHLVGDIQQRKDFVFTPEEVRTLHALDSHCKVQGIVGFLSTSNEKLTVQTRLGKYGVYKLDYDLRGAFRDFGAEFLVEGPGF